MKFKQIFLQLAFYSLTIAIASACFLAPSDAKKVQKNQKNQKNTPNGKQVFQEHCSSCHLAGGNSVKPSRPVAESDELKSLFAFKAYLSSPPGHMPYYQNIVGDSKVLESLYKYCKTLKKQPLRKAMLQ